MASGKQPIASALRRSVYYTGQVQGVGFRYTVQALASQHEVTGLVRNLTDGSVEMIVEGTSAEIDRLIEAIDQAMADYISSKTVSDSEPTGDFVGFRITY